jgi:hypothetical protein
VCKEIGPMLKEQCVQHVRHRADRRAYLAGSRSLIAEHFTEVQCGQRDRVREGEVSYPDSSKVPWAPTQRHGIPLLTRGYCISTERLDEETIRKPIREQEDEEERQEQLPFGGLQSRRYAGRAHDTLYPKLPALRVVADLRRSCGSASG